MNHLVDDEIVDELYAASAAGADIDLIVRGQCCLRPGVPGLSERIRVRSLVGKYLEHSRVMRFGEGPGAAYFVGSADMMPRNLNRRVEVITPIDDPSLRLRLEEILRVCLADDTLAWELGPDGTWAKVPTTRGMSTHRRLEALAVERARGAAPDPGRAATPAGVVVAAGGVVTRRSSNGKPEVLLVHRPAYDDWSFPKGKAKHGEPLADAARREVLEETGYECTVGAGGRHPGVPRPQRQPQARALLGHERHRRGVRPQQRGRRDPLAARRRRPAPALLRPRPGGAALHLAGRGRKGRR